MNDFIIFVFSLVFAFVLSALVFYFIWRKFKNIFQTFDNLGTQAFDSLGRKLPQEYNKTDKDYKEKAEIAFKKFKTGVDSEDTNRILELDDDDNDEMISEILLPKIPESSDNPYYLKL